MGAPAPRRPLLVVAGVDVDAGDLLLVEHGHVAPVVLEAQLQVEGVHATKTEEAIGTIAIVLSESLREYVWTAEISIGSDEK